MNTFLNLAALHSTTRDKATRDRIEAILTERYRVSIYVVSNWIDEQGDPAIEYRGYDLIAAIEALYEAGRVVGFETRNQMWHLFSEINDESICLDSREICAINAATDDILYEVKKHFGGKYTYQNGIKLRIADHSGKWANNSGEHCISIVIANKNATAKFRQSADGIPHEYFFDESNTVTEIVEFINNELNITVQRYDATA